MGDEVYNLAVDFGVHLANLFALFLDSLGDLFAFFTDDGTGGRTSDPHDFRFFGHGCSPTPLLATLLGTFFRALMLGFPRLFFLGNCRMWEDAETRRQSLFLALFFSPFNVDINIVWVAPFLLELPTLLPEAAFIETFAFGQMLGEIGVHVAPNLLDLDYRALQ
jgi:hypothetical protein